MKNYYFPMFLGCYIAPSIQRIIKNIDPNYINSQLQEYATHNAQIDYPKIYHLVSDADTYELVTPWVLESLQL
jgi:hypothetical protein